MKSRRRKRTDPKKKIAIISIILILVWISAFYLYTTYSQIKIEPIEYETTKLSSTEYEETVENAEENNQLVADVIEKTTR